MKSAMQVFLYFSSLVAAVALSATPSNVNSSIGFLQDQDIIKFQSADRATIADIADQMPEQTPDVKFPDKSRLGPGLQWFLSITWVLMLASLPSVVPLVNRKMPTRSQIIVGIAMLIVFLGGLWLFTHIILFQSIHFKTIRPLTLVECMYFMSQVITTVGYGDITPAKVRGQVFVGLYVLGAMFIISMVVSDVVNQVIESAEAYKRRVHGGAHEAHEEDTDAPHGEHSGENSQKAGEGAKKKKKANTRKGQRPKGVKEVKVGPIEEMLCITPPERPPITNLVLSLTAFASLDIMWVMFFSMHPDEGKTVFQAIYMSVITLSSVGFGWFTPVTEEGMIFAAYFMIFGCAALVNVITQFTELMMKMNEYEKLLAHPGKNKAHIHLEHHEEHHDDNEGISEIEFLEFCLLQMGCVGVEHLEKFEEAFHDLSPDSDGNVELSAIKEKLIGLTGKQLTEPASPGSP